MSERKGRSGFTYVQLSGGSTQSKRCTPAKVVLPVVVVAAVCVVALLAIAIAVGLTLTSSHAPLDCRLDSIDRFDCLPGTAKPSEKTCEDLGCCWDDSKSPFCFHSPESGYVVEEPFQNTNVGIRGCLTRKHQLTSAFGESLERLCVNITFEGEDRLRIKVYDPSVARFEVPLDVPTAISQFEQSKAKYKVKLVNETFSFSVLRNEDNKPIFRLAPGFIFANQFIQLSAHLPTSNIYGLGEHVTHLRLPMDNTTFTLFAADIFPNPDVPAQNLYGVHPFYLGLEEDGRAHGVLLLNSNAMDVTLQTKPSITYRFIGGLVDLYFFLGPSPEQVVQQYTDFVGRPFFPPYWALGFHLCRWGYGSANNTWNVVKRMRELDVPQDVQWIDIDYMSNHLDFTYDQERFAELPEMVNDIHQHGQKFIVITDPGISNHEPNGSYEPYNLGVEMNVFVKNSSGGLLVGRVWPDLTVYPDFFHPNASLYWEQQIRQFHDNVSFDGLWIDMNEPSNFVNGSIDGCGSSTLDHPPYIPGTLKESSIVHKTLCMSAQQHSSSHYNLHSLYGHSEAKATMNALEKVLGQRSIVISRSTFIGSGRYTGHWLGDNASQWKHMASSIPGILHFSLFGIPLVGADICGFFDHPTEELCVRWQQLGAFYPFARNHNIKDTPAQDPTVWSSAAVDVIRNALLLRYTLLPYLYTLFYLAHVNGSTVARPLFFEFPRDSQTWGIESQFMWGSALLISPVLEKKASSINVYLPPSARWYTINSSLLTQVNSGGEIKMTGHVTTPVSLSSIPVHVRGGSIIPVQQANTTTYKSRQNPFSIMVAVDANNKASGKLFADDGHSLSGARDGTLLSLSFDQGRLVSRVQEAGSNQMPLDNLNTELKHVYILGLAHPPHSNVTLNQTLQLNHTWNDPLKVLRISLTGTSQHVTSPFVIAWDT